MDTKSILEIFLSRRSSNPPVFIASDEGQKSVLTHFQQEDTTRRVGVVGILLNGFKTFFPSTRE